ncbi:MAG: hypothetical protein NXI04_12180 [Planctomycetaceae bacterium]|nr:hypothetical protein [Planctomycetaceae bacterium]
MADALDLGFSLSPFSGLYSRLRAIEAAVVHHMPKSTPQKPVVSSDFPLSWHKRAGYWYKKINYKQWRFGLTTDPAEALADYKLNGDRIRRGLPKLTPEQSAPGLLKVQDLISAWLKDRNQKCVNTPEGTKGKISGQTYAEYERVARLLNNRMGNRAVTHLTEDDFAGLAAEISSLAVATQRRRKTIIRGIFTCKTSRRLYSSVPDFSVDMIDFGDAFELENTTELKFRRQRPEHVIDVEDLRKILEESSPRLKACIHLGINCMMNAKDCSDLSQEAINGEWLENVRLKKYTPRKMWLWPETLEALGAVKCEVKVPVPNGQGHMWMVTNSGRPLVRTDVNGNINCHCGFSERLAFEYIDSWICDACGAEYQKAEFRVGAVTENRKDLIHQEWSRHAKYCGVEGVFSALRGTAATVARDAGHQVDCVKLAMGQANSDVLHFYLNDDPREKLKRMGESLREWFLT